MISPVRTNRSFGGEGEEIAKAFLEKKGFQWLHSQYSTKWGEIDLIMEDGNTLVFVEVKRRRGDQLYGPPEESITRRKIQHLMRVALSYIRSAQADDKMIRFDVVTIDADGIRHLPDAFQGGEEFYH